ncbi:MAG: hypothetical protein R2822_25535 [Spirosomataceae bacterium]
MFISLMLTTSVGVWLLFPLLQGYYRFKAHQTIATQPAELVLLRLHSSKFSRIGNHEIEYKGLRYDLKSEQIKGKIHEFVAYPDVLETQLLAFVGETWKSITDTTSSSSPVGKLIKKMLSLDLFLVPDALVSLGFEYLSFSKTHFSSISSYSFSFCTYLERPPKVL